MCSVELVRYRLLHCLVSNFFRILRFVSGFFFFGKENEEKYAGSHSLTAHEVQNALCFYIKNKRKSLLVLLFHHVMIILK
jgi:hypothetical protein